ncbi:MAG: YvcK family protein, partial [Eggerthellaceae bacterium]|nr:YvcK family protein [Eggerthellaceae bacterium]
SNLPSPLAKEVRAVVIGGGTGAPISIITLLSMGIRTNAVVAMADDGGSTGILRQEARVTPPGDVRKCMVAFARNPDDPMTKAFRYRFEFARNHTLGNLMLSALEEATGSFIEAIDICEELLDVRGHVYPSTLELVTLIAKTKSGDYLRGQANASKSKTALERVWLESVQKCRPCEMAIKAIREADLIVLGPGSLFTSIIPNLLVPGIVEAIESSKGKTLFVCSLADMQGETAGMSAREHVEALLEHGMRGRLDFALIHRPSQAMARASAKASRLSTDSKAMKSATRATREFPAKGQASAPAGISGAIKPEIVPVFISSKDMQAIEAQGPRVLVRNLVDRNRPTWHDPHALKDAFREVLKLCRLPLI